MKGRQSRFHHQDGISLILTLGMLAVVLILAMGFLVSMRTEQVASRNFTQVITARQMANAAVDEAMFLIRKDTPVITNQNNYWISQPGFIRGKAGSDLLYSVSSAGIVDINSDRSIAGSNGVYSNATARVIQVNWVNIGVSGGVASASNPIIGRYAYWVDDDASKININSSYTRGDTSASTNGATTKEVDLTVLYGLGIGAASNTYNYAQTNTFFTADQWKILSAINPTNWSVNKFFVTADSDAVAKTPWGSKKINLNDPDSGLTRSMIDDPSSTLTNAALGKWFGTPGGVNNDFARKYGIASVKQILANMYDFRMPAGGSSGTICTGADAAFGSDGGLDAGGDGYYGIPRNYLGLRRYPFLNEISVQPTFFRPSGEIQAKVWVLCELVNPYDQPWGNNGQIRLHMNKLRYYVRWGSIHSEGYYCGRETDWVDGSCPNVHYDSAQERTYDITNNVPANSYWVFPVSAYAGCTETDGDAWVEEVYVSINKVRLLQTPDQDRTIRDWIYKTELDVEPFSVNEQFGFVSTAASNCPILHVDVGGIPPYSNACVQGFAKNDPRVRRFTSTGTPPKPAWYRVGYNKSTNASVNAENFGATNINFTASSGTGRQNVDPDPTETGYGVTNRSTFFANTTASGTNDYETAGQLGYIHTGLQWRTLNLLPQTFGSGNETGGANSNYIPDWIVLDIFGTTNTGVQGRININGAVTNLASATTPLRYIPITALGSNLNLTGVGALGASAASDILTQKFTTSFTNRYYTNTFFTNAYTFAGQICEVGTISGSSGTPKAQRESRIRSLANLINVRGERYSVWAIGQTVQVDPTGKTNILGEAKAQAVVKRLQKADSSGVYGNSNNTNTYSVIYFRYMTEPVD